MDGSFIWLRVALPLVSRAIPQVAKHLAVGTLVWVAINLVNLAFMNGVITYKEFELMLLWKSLSIITKFLKQ